MSKYRIIPPCGEDRKEILIAVHGLFLSGIWLYPLAKHAAAAGYTAAVYSYRTTRARLAVHGTEFACAVREIMAKYPDHRISFAGHSLGGLMIRTVLESVKIPPERMGRIFFMGVPHKGSPVARFVRKYIFFTDRLIKVMPDLDSTPPDDAVKLSSLPQMGFAAAYARFDHLVPASSSHLPGAEAEGLYPTTHTGLIFNRKVRRDLVKYLITGTI